MMVFSPVPSFLIAESKVQPFIALVLGRLVVLFPILVRPVPCRFGALAVHIHQMIPLEQEKHNRQQQRPKQDPEPPDEPGCILVPEQVHRHHVTRVHRDDVQRQRNASLAHRRSVGGDPGSLSKEREREEKSRECKNKIEHGQMMPR